MKSIISFLLCLKQSLSSSSSDWDYDYMSEWSNEYSMCASLDESPINIKPLETVTDSSVCGGQFDWNIDFTHQTFKITNNGHSLSLKAIEKSSIENFNGLSNVLEDTDGNEYISLALSDNTIATFPNYFAQSSDAHQRYCLDSLHFHWGTTDQTGSEHLFEGKQYPLEVQFVHYTCDHASLGSTLEQFPSKESVELGIERDTDIHQLGVVAIMFDVVEDRINPAFDVIFANETLRNITFPNDDKVDIVNGFDLSQLLPDHVTTEGYYAYQGSLTTPPCTDIVNWHVMNARGYIGKSQMEKFRTLMSTETYAIAPNYRETQSNINTVYSCVNVKTLVRTIKEKQPLNTGMVAVSATLAFAVVIGILSFFVYKKITEEKIAEMKDKKTDDKPLRTNDKPLRTNVQEIYV